MARLLDGLPSASFERNVDHGRYPPSHQDDLRARYGYDIGLEESHFLLPKPQNYHGYRYEQVKTTVHRLRSNLRFLRLRGTPSIWAILPCLLLFWLVWRWRVQSERHNPQPVLTNGSHPFLPTTILISLDGFRLSYLDSHANLLPNLLSIGKSSNGVRSELLQPQFPTLTFPNHWTLMTGLYPESHGIVANEFWDPVSKSEFIYTDEAHSWNSDWWWGEPIWSVVEEAGLRSANMMWPGPPRNSRGTAPTLFTPFAKMATQTKLSEVMGWIDSPFELRPQFVAVYMPNIDQAGHQFGPESHEVANEILAVDNFIGGLRQRLADRNLTLLVDVVIVSDHGKFTLEGCMSNTTVDQYIVLEDVLGATAIGDLEHRDGWPAAGLRFKDDAPHDTYLNYLSQAADESQDKFAVYTHDTMPSRWHFSHGSRIAPIYIMPALGWAVVEKASQAPLNSSVDATVGNHGYDNVEQDMQAIFFAEGPSVRLMKRLNNNASCWSRADPTVIKGFSNVEIYSLVLTMLGIPYDAQPSHNGTTAFWSSCGL